MATVEVAGKVKVGEGFSNATEIRRAVYDFAVDGGASADKHVLMEVDSDMVIHSAYVKVLDAVTGTSSTVAVGIEGGTEVEILAATAEASLLAGTLHKKDDSLPLKVASGSNIVMIIGAADLTAGKLELVIQKGRF